MSKPCSINSDNVEDFFGGSEDSGKSQNELHETLFYQAIPQKSQLMWLWCKDPHKKLPPALALKAERRQKGLKHVFKKWLQDSELYTEEQLALPAVERRRLLQSKNVNRSSAALKRKREDDGKFLSGPKRLFKTEKVRLFNIAHFLISAVDLEQRKLREFEKKNRD